MTNQCEWLQYEVDRYRDEERQRQDEADERRRQRDEERREQREWNSRHANSWPEALRKQMFLFQNESSQWFTGENDEYPDDCFGPGAEACARALEIWKEVEANNAAKIAELEKQIEAIRDGIRNQVADRLEAEATVSGWRHVVQAIRDGHYNEWLQW